MCWNSLFLLNATLIYMTNTYTSTVLNIILTFTLTLYLLLYVQYLLPVLT